MSEIELYGTVGGSFWDEECFSPRTVRSLLQGLTGDLTVRLNSGGGIASDGQAIYTMLRDYSATVGRVTVVIEGVAASAASLIAMAGDEIVMRLGSWMLIHDPAQAIVFDARGTAEDHREIADFLDTLGDNYADVYAARAGITREEARAIMLAETVYLGEAAVAAGFATSTDNGIEAQEPAAFDYRVYANAPQIGRVGCEGRGANPRRVAAVAMIAGETARMNMGKTNMPNTQIQEPPVVADPAIAAPSAAPVAPVPPVAAPDATSQGAGAAPVEMSGGDVARLFSIGGRLGATTAQISAAMSAHPRSFTMALDVLSETLAEVAPPPMMGRQTSRVLRDEQETRRAGMTDALAAQMMRQTPDARAMPFMQMSIVEMASQASGYSGPLRTASDRVRALEMAAHSTSDFPAVFENAVNRTLLAAYEAATPTYQSIAMRSDFNDFRPHAHVQIGEFPALERVGEGGEIKFGTVGESKETAVLTAYARGLSFSRQMLINDDLGAIARVIAGYGSTILDFEEQTAWAYYLSAKLADGKDVFHASRNNLTTPGGAITTEALDVGRAKIRKQTRLDGERKVPTNFVPSILVCGPNLEGEAMRLLTPVVASEASNVNTHAGRLEGVITNEIAGNAWFLFADPNRPGAEVFTYGYLDGATGPRLRTEEAFGRQGFAMTVEHDFGVGAVGYRGAYKNAGQ